MSAGNNTTDYIALKHPTGKLRLWEEQGEWKAEFLEIGRDNLLVFLSERLSTQLRFSGCLETAWTVLDHSFTMAAYAQKIGLTNNEVATLGMHDAAEIICDQPTPFKIKVDCDREDAIFRALDLPEFVYKGMDGPAKEKWDWIACLAEAAAFGHPQWKWWSSRVTPFMAADFLSYKDFQMDVLENSTLQTRKSRWLELARNPECPPNLW